jgi:hypothetical protein
MLGIAQLCRQGGEIELCQQQCQKIISADPSNEQVYIRIYLYVYIFYPYL